jgi:HEPN domain-containing protein
MTASRSAKLIEHAVATTSLALDRMAADLPKTASPQAALEQVVRELAVQQPWFMRLIMEDHYIREAYDDAVASTPLRAKGK